MIGQTISHYRIVEKLGSGGMGVVWKAHDTRLNRTVALKMLPPDFADDPERRHRFLREAQAASALSHPHIITVFDILEHDGTDVIVMEYIAGKTLDALIPRKGMRLNQALPISTQVAEALSAAHRANIVHRDLKPGNVMVSDSGNVKVLDFGLAKSVAEQRANSQDDATQTLAPATQEGIAVGTVAYMSPEQAEGRPVDTRTDIFSFGAMLYEMLTGERAFRGDTNLATMAAVVHTDVKPLPSDIPPELQRIVQRCLRKEARRRFQHMDDLAVALEELREEHESGTTPAAAVAQRPVRQSRRWILAVTLAALCIAVLAIWAVIRHGRTPEPLPALADIPLTTEPGTQLQPDFSPDGNQVTYVWTNPQQDSSDIYVKVIGSPSPLRLTTDPAPEHWPAFSPDGRSIAFTRSLPGHNLLITIPPIGGPEKVIAELPSYAERVSWFPDGKAVLVSGLALVSLDTGEVRPLLPTLSAQYRIPAVAPDGHAVAFAQGTESGANIYLLELDQDRRPKGAARPLTNRSIAIFGIAWTADNTALIASFGNLGAASNLYRLSLSKPEEPELLPFGRNGGAAVAISRTGNRLAYSQSFVFAHLWRTHLASAAVTEGPAQRLLPSTRTEENLAYSPDGKRVVFGSNRSGNFGLWVGDVAASQAAELFIPPVGHAGSPDWSPDSRTIAFDWNEIGKFQMYTMRANGGKPVRLSDGMGNESAPNWSADGKWIYFSSNRSGRYEVWRTASSGGPPVQVTRHGGANPKTSPDGRVLCFFRGNAVWRVSADSGSEEVQVAAPVVSRNFAVTATGVYFITPRDSTHQVALKYVPFDGGEAKVVVSLPEEPSRGVRVSPDGRWLVYTQVEQAGEEVRLVDNFR